MEKKLLNIFNPGHFKLTQKKQRAEYIAGVLEKLYPETPVPLDHTSPYTLLIAVLLSAQCTDERVNKITPALFKLADNPWDMRKLKVSAIEDIVRPCGLGPKKALAIWQLSEILCTKYQGEVPKTLEELEELPGVGHKTASVVVAQAFGVPAFPVDTHIHRLAQLWKLTEGKNVQQTERDLKKIFAEEKWNKLHLQIIFYGREYCQARTCKGIVCPICTTIFPSRKRSIEFNRA